MGTVTGLTSVRMLAIEAASVVSGAISGDNLILTKYGGGTINAGNVRGPQGITRGRNKIINGDFSVNQRSFVSATTWNTWGHDRWNFLCQTGTCTYSPQAPTLGTLPESPKAHARVVTTSQIDPNSVSVLLQKIENVRTLSGKTITVSFWAKSGSGTPSIAVEASQYFGTGGSPSSSVSIPGGKTAITTSWQRYSVTFAIPSISGKTIGTDGSDFLQIAFWFSAGTSYNSQSSTLGLQNNTFDIWGVQVEEGAAASAFEQKTYVEELRDCQRYFYRFGPSPGINMPFCVLVGWNSTNFYSPIIFPETMRAAPSFAASAASTFLAHSMGQSPALSLMSITGSNKQSAELNVTTASAISYPCCWLRSAGAGSYMDFNAEL